MTRTSVLAFTVVFALTAPLAAQDEPGAPGPIPPGSELPSGHPAIDPVPGDEDPRGSVDAFPSGHPHVDGGEGSPGAGTGHGMPGMGDAAVSRMLSPPETATAEPAPDLAPGSIRILVVDEADAPVADAEIELGVMRAAGDRSRLPARTGPDGVYVFEGLETGGDQAYRVNVLYEGATYSSTPFQLPLDTGYTSRVRRLPVSHDDRLVLQFVAQTLIEFREGRVHIIVQAQLANAGEATYVFPGEGVRMRLPDGFLAFQSQAVMTDQHVEEQPGYGLRIRGSLPPGSVTLAWGFDVPVTGDELTMRIGNPFRTMRYRVISEAPEGLAMEVEGFPRSRRVDSDGQILLATELQRRPGDAALDEVSIRLRGIPGPGPLRHVALGLAILLLVGGIARLVRRTGTAKDATARRIDELARRKTELLAAAGAIEAEHAAGEIGDGYRQKRRAAIVMELAGVLYREERLRDLAPPAATRTAAERATAMAEERSKGTAEAAQTATIAEKSKKKGHTRKSGSGPTGVARR